MEKSIEELVLELEDNHNKLIDIQSNLGELKVREVKYMARSYLIEIVGAANNGLVEYSNPRTWLEIVRNIAESAIEELG